MTNGEIWKILDGYEIPVGVLRDIIYYNTQNERDFTPERIKNEILENWSFNLDLEILKYITKGCGLSHTGIVPGRIHSLKGYNVYYFGRRKETIYVLDAINLVVTGVKSSAEKKIIIETVQDIIDELEKVEDKSKRITVYTEGNHLFKEDFQNIHSVDFDLSDRVELNIIDPT